MTDAYPRAIFYDSKNTLFDWTGKWVEATEAILEKHDDPSDPNEVKLTWQRFLTGWQHRAAFGRYLDISDCLRGSLEDAMRFHDIDGDPADADAMIGAWDDVYPFPDTVDALTRQQEYTDIIIFSNVESEYLRMMVDKMGGFEPDLLATMQDAGAIKPNPRAYQWVLDEMGLEKSEVLYAAGPIWDLNGASAYGLQCAQISRPSTSQPENRELQFEPAHVVDDLSEVTELLETGGLVPP